MIQDLEIAFFGTLAGTYGKQLQDQAKSRDAAIEFISQETAKATKGGIPDKAEEERIRGTRNNLLVLLNLRPKQ